MQPHSPTTPRLPSVCTHSTPQAHSHVKLVGRFHVHYFPAFCFNGVCLSFSFHFSATWFFDVYWPCPVLVDPGRRVRVVALGFSSASTHSLKLSIVLRQAANKHA
ncbi:hypothetical protein TRVL_05001 [Trypanosoma vivax]|nr:hypothetical protein TRVL_05001 [Trypanosoma vivax]